MQPTLTGRRVALRPFSLQGASGVQALAGAPEIASTTLTIPHPYEDGVAEARIQRHAPGHSAGTSASFASVAATTQEVVGAMGLAIKAALILAAFLAVGACTRGSDGAAGTSLPTEWTVDPEPLLTIGVVDGDLDYVFARIAAVRLLPDGRLVVADGSSGSIRIYGSDGVLERRMGGTGQGPGEFTYLSALSWAPPDTILAYDSRALRLTKFLTTGQLVSTQAFQASAGYPEVYIGTYSDGSHAFAWINQRPRDRSVATPDVMEIGRFGPSGQHSVHLDTAFGMRRLGSPLPFSAHFLAAMLGDTVFHTDGLGGIVKAVGPTGEPVRTFHVPLDRWEFEAARRRLEPELDTAAMRRLRELEGVPSLDSIPVIAELFADGEGRLWIKGYEPSTDSHWTRRRRTGGEWLVVERDGTVIARISLPAGVRLVDVSADRIVGVAFDDLGVERVQVFALLRGEPAT